VAKRPILLVRRSLANDPLEQALVFFGTFGGMLAIFIGGGMPDPGAAIVTPLVFAIATAIIQYRVKKWRWWRRLHHLPIPLDVDSYMTALHGVANRAHLDVEIAFAGPPPGVAELVQLAGRDGGATLDGAVAHVVSPTCLTINRDSRAWMQYHTNQKLDRWFRKLVSRLVPLHRQHAIEKISVTHVRNG